MLLMIFGLTVGEFVSVVTLLGAVIGAVVMFYNRVTKNEEEIKIVAKTSCDRIDALEKNTKERIDALEKTTCSEMKAMIRTTEAKIEELESGRKQNADNIALFRGELQEFRKETRDDLSRMFDILYQLLMRNEDKGNRRSSKKLVSSSTENE